MNDSHFGDRPALGNDVRNLGRVGCLSRAAVFIYFFFCSLLLIAVLCMVYSQIPVKKEWSIEDVRMAAVHGSELENDHYRWSPISPGCQLLNLARADFEASKKYFVPDIGRTHRGYRCYFRFRVVDPDLSAKIEQATKRELPPLGYPFRGDEGPLPAWWTPTDSVQLEMIGNSDAIYVDHAQPGIAFALLKYDYDW